MDDMPIIDNTIEYNKKEMIEPMDALETQKYNEGISIRIQGYGKSIFFNQE